MTEFRYHVAVPQVRAAWQRAGLHDEGPDSESGIRDLGLGVSSEVRTPIPSPQPPAPLSCDVPLVVFFGAELQRGPEWCLPIVLGIVSKTLALDPCSTSPREIRFDAVVERPNGNGCTCVEYKGDAFELVALAKYVRRVWAGK
jgi:hypothetical protein